MITRALARFFLRSPWSTVVALVGVALGVVSIVSIHLVSVQIGDRLKEVSDIQFGSITHLLHRDDLKASDYFELRRAWREGKLGEQRIVSLAPFVDEEANLGGTRFRVVGVDLFAQGEIGEARSGGGGPFSWRGVWVTESVADRMDRPVNGTLDGPFPLIVADIGVALEILGKPPDYLSYVGIEVGNPLAAIGQTIENLLPGSSAGLPTTDPGIPLVDWRVTSLDDVQPTNRFGQSILFNVSALATLAILVSWFLIYQVAVTWLRRLQGLFTRLHMLGVGRLEIVLRFLGALGMLGAVASVPGVMLGRELAVLLLGAIGDPPSDVALDIWVVAKGAFSAIGVFVAGGMLAFRQVDEVKLSRSLALLAVLVALCIAGVIWERSGLAGAFVSIGALSFVATLTMRPLLQKLRAVSRYFKGRLLWRLSARELFWYPRDLSVSVGGLVLAVATAMGVGLMVDSFRADFAEMLERRLSYDFVADGRSEDLASVAAGLAGDARVARLQRYVDRDVRVLGVRIEQTDTHLDAFETKRYGLDRLVADDEVLVSEQLAKALGARGLNVSVGQTVAGRRIAGTFRSFGDMQPRMIVQGAGLEPPTGVSLLVAAGVDPAPFLDELEQRFASVRFTRAQDMRANALETFDQTFAITEVLITIALLVAGIGIFIANQALRLNKLASSQMLTVMGVTRAESWLMDGARSLVTGVVAVVLAVPLGLAFGWILCNVVNPRAFGWSIELGVDAGALLYPAYWGVFAAVLAGTLRLGVGEETRFSDARAL